MNFVAANDSVIGRRLGSKSIYSWRKIKETFDASNTSAHIQFNFYRHGETVSNAQGLISGQEDSPLSQNGIDSARTLRSKIPNMYDEVFCSGLIRSQQTMQTALGGNQFFLIDPRLNEFDFGLLTGKKRYFIKEFADGDIDYRPPGGETYREFAQRIFSFFVDTIREDKCIIFDQRIYLVFAHAGVLRVVGSLKPGKCPTAKDMFLANYKNLEALVICSDNCKLPDFWVS